MKSLPGSSYNPYEDDRIHSVQPDPWRLGEDRDPFNDVIDHRDIVSGYRTAKQIHQYPKSVRFGVRIMAATMIVSLLIAGLSWILD